MKSNFIKSNKLEVVIIAALIVIFSIVLITSCAPSKPAQSAQTTPDCIPTQQYSSTVQSPQSDNSNGLTGLAAGAVAGAVVGSMINNNNNKRNAAVGTKPSTTTPPVYKTTTKPKPATVKPPIKKSAPKPKPSIKKSVSKPVSLKKSTSSSSTKKK